MPAELQTGRTLLYCFLVCSVQLFRETCSNRILERGTEQHHDRIEEMLLQ